MSYAWGFSTALAMAAVALAILISMTARKLGARLRNRSRRAMWRFCAAWASGVGGSWGDYTLTSATGLPNNNGYVTDGQQQFFAFNATTVADGEHWRVAPQTYYYVGPFSLLGEYTISAQNVRQTVAPFQQALLRNTGWQVAAGWVLTGEDATFTGVTPQCL